MHTMKQATRILTALVFFSLVVYVGCKPKTPATPPDPRDTQAGLITGKNWSPSDVKLDGTDRDEWDNTTFGFTYNPSTDEGTITVTNPPTNPGAEDVFSNDLGWEFGGTAESPNISQIVRDDDVTMNLTINEAAGTLTLTFGITGSGSRVAGFDGQWSFTFTN